MPVAADPMVERLLSERGETVAKIERIKTSALDRKRDLTNEELEDIKEYSTRIKTLDTHLETVTENAALSW
jgi:hypothetical protein